MPLLDHPMTQFAVPVFAASFLVFRPEWIRQRNSSWHLGAHNQADM
jgi:hypothetical protein